MNILNITELKRDILKLKKINYFLKKEEKLSLHRDNSVTQNYDDNKMTSRKTFVIYAVVLFMVAIITIAVTTNNVFDSDLLASFAILSGAFAIQQLKKSNQ